MDEKETTILVIEDESVLCQSIADYFEDQDFNVLTASDGRVGLELFEREGPDLVLTDLRMPVVDGLEVLRRVGELSVETPLIVISGTGRLSDSIEALHLGAWDYLVKPIEDMSIILHSVNRSLERARLLHENRMYQEHLEQQVAERTAELEQANANLKNINERLQKVLETTRTLSASTDVATFGSTLLSEFAKHMAAETGSLFLLKTEGLQLIQTMGTTDCPPFIPFPLLEKSMLARAVKTGEPLLIRDIAAENSRFAQGWDEYKAGSALIFPLPDETGQLFGVLVLHNRTASTFTERDKEIGAIVASYSCETFRATSAIETLRESEARFRDLAETLPEVIFETDEEMKLTYANQRAFELFGYSTADLAAGLNGFELLVPEDRASAKGNLAQRMEGEKIPSVEYRAIRKDGSTFPILFYMGPIIKDQKNIGFRGIIIDITERKRAEQEKAQIEEQYHQAQKVESIGRLAGGVSHDLNNLLSPILGFGELLLNDFTPGDPRRKKVEQVVQAGVRARDLVRQLLAFSRKQTLEYKPLDMNKVIAGFEKLLRRTIREEIEIRFKPATLNETVMADIGQIEQVLMNLSVNAQDAIAHGGTITIETGIAELDDAYATSRPNVQPGKYVLLAVSDTGSGMDGEVQKHLFEPFFSTKGEHGTGLGLATVYGIVKQHGGNIWVYSEPHQGTTFKVYLPVSKSRAPKTPSTAPMPIELAGSESILLVEDNDQVRDVGFSILARQGYHVLTARNGPEALRILDRLNRPIQLLLTDVIMPEMNGKELYTHTIKLQPDIKVLYMSGYTDEVIVHRGVLEAGTAFIQKPFSVLALAAKVREVLDGV